MTTVERLRAFFFCLTAPFVIAAQTIANCPEGQSVSGLISDKSPTTKDYTIYLQPVEGAIIDSVRTENGAFSFCLPSDILPYYVLTVAESPQWKYYFLTDFSSQTRVLIESLGERTAQTKGTPLWERWSRGKEEVRTIFGQYLRERRQPHEETEWPAIKRHYDQLLCKTFVSLLSEDPTMGIAVLHSEITRMESMDLSWETVTTLRDLLLALPAGLTASAVSQALLQTLARHIYAREDAQILDFSVSGLYGNMLSTRDYHGQYLLLDFWGSWCKPCIEKNELLRSRYPELQSHGLTAMTIMMDYAHQPFSEELLEIALKNDPAYPWPQGILFQNEADLGVMDYYRAYMVPRTILINPAGRVIAVNPTLDEMLEKIVGKRP